MKIQNSKFNPFDELRARMQNLAKGFTLIELLVVIALLGILAVAVLAAINPIEQLKKGRDTQRQNDSKELLGAYERYYASQQKYPWAADLAITASSNTVTTGITGAGSLITLNEIKSQFANRSTVTKGEMCISETQDLVTVCFVPESTAARNGSLGTLAGTADGTGVANCAGVYVAGCASSCYMCLPQ